MSDYVLKKVKVGVDSLSGTYDFVKDRIDSKIKEGWETEGELRTPLSLRNYFCQNIVKYEYREVKVEYTHGDVIIDPDKALPFKDKLVACGSNPYEAITNANNGVFRTFKAARSDIAPPSPFETDGMYGLNFYFTCIIPRKGLPYKESQADWVKRQNVVAGSKVKIVKAFSKKEGELCGCKFEGNMNSLIGETLEVREVAENYIRVYQDDRKKYSQNWPFFCLEAIKEIKCPVKVGDYFKWKGRIYKVDKIENGYVIPAVLSDGFMPPIKISPSEIHKITFRPFDLIKKEERDQLRGKWIVHAPSGTEFLMNGFYIQGGEYTLGGRKSKELLKDWTFLDTGLPVGVEVEE